MRSLWFSLLFILAGIVAMASTSKASAQNWYAQPSMFAMTPADTALLPMSVTYGVLDPTAGSTWQPTEHTTWIAIWPRNAAGAWYRPSPYSQPSLRKTNVYPYPYSCTTSGNGGFTCRDLVRGINRYPVCPTQAYIGWIHKWRSHYNSAWPEQGLFYASGGPWGAHGMRAVALHSSSVTAAGRQLNCMYGNLTGAGPGLAFDMWIWRL